jgi:hypothetical protein
MGRVFPDKKDGRCKMGLGDYGQNKYGGGTWYVRTPEHGAMVSLLDHTVTENPDKTITVKEPIEVSVMGAGGPEILRWQLENGKWKKLPSDESKVITN